MLTGVAGDAVRIDAPPAPARAAALRGARPPPRTAPAAPGATSSDIAASGVEGELVRNAAGRSRLPGQRDRARVSSAGPIAAARGPGRVAAPAVND